MASADTEEKLVGEKRTEQLSQLKGWSEVDGRDAIQRKFEFKDFKEAFSFMTRVALAAEQVCTHSSFIFFLRLMRESKLFAPFERPSI